MTAFLQHDSDDIPSPTHDDVPDVLLSSLWCSVPSAEGEACDHRQEDPQ